MRSPVAMLGQNHVSGAHIFFAGGQVAQGDAVGHRADGDAQVAAHAFVFFHRKVALAVFAAGNGLVRGVFAGDVAAPALDATVLVDDGLADVVEVEVAPVAYAGNGLADDVGYVAKPISSR